MPTYLRNEVQAASRLRTPYVCKTELLFHNPTFTYGYLSDTTDGDGIICYVYDAWNRIAEYKFTPANPPAEEIITFSRTNTWGLDLSGTMQGAGGVGALLAVRQGGVSYYPTFDGNGNISEYLGGNGIAVAHFEYDPFGNLVVDSFNNAADFPYRFSTKPQDMLSGWYYYGYRWYDPLTGKWLSRDPIGEDGGINLYGFVGNDGVNWQDFLGLASVVQTGQRERHHWFPLDKGAGNSKFNRICPGYSINAWTTPYHQSDHGMFNSIGYTKKFWAAVDANPKITCCELLLFGRVMMTAMNAAMVFRGRGPIVSPEYPQSRFDLLRMGLPPLYEYKDDKPSNPPKR